MRRALALLLLLGAIAAPSSQAAPFSPSLDHFYRLAIHYWGGEPERCVSIDMQIVPDGSLPDEHEAEASVPKPGEHIECFLYLTRKLVRPERFGYTCTVMIHEVGHLHGLGHNLEPGNVMNPDDREVPGICWRAMLRRLNELRYHPRTSNDR